MLVKGVEMLLKGYYQTKGGHLARKDITRDEQLGVVLGIGFVAYNLNGEFAYKDSDYDNHPGDSLDLLIEYRREAIDERN